MSETLQEKMERLKKEGHTIYSISRLNTFNECKYAYNKTYNEGDRGKDNIYSIAGSSIHDVLENIYNDKATKDDLIKAYEGTMKKCEMFGIKFPTEQIENNWKADMGHFVYNFEKINLRAITEQFILFEILPGIWVQGYIDAIFADSCKLLIIDWKSSSEFKGNKLLEAGRQLALYKLAIEELTGRKVDEVAWFMMKYVYVKYGNKQKMCARRKWVKDISNLLKTDLKKLGTPEFVIPMMIEEAIQNNNLDNMPEEVKTKYKIEDCVLYYDVTEEVINELKEYIFNTVKAIESETEWQPPTIDKNQSFFCNTLCNHRDNCTHIKEYNKQFLEENPVDDIMKLF